MRQLYVGAIVSAMVVVSMLLATGITASNGPVWP